MTFLVILGYIGSFLAGAALKTEVGSMQTEIKKISEVLINQADQNRRIIHLEEDLRELRHGRGFVQGERGIDREYPQAVR
jgi:hypothetical protein